MPRDANRPPARRASGSGALFYSAKERRWIAKVTIGTRNGKPVQRRIVGPRGDRSANARLALEDKLFVLRKEQPYRGEIAPSTNLADYLSKWLANRDLSEAARGTYGWAINNHIVPALGARELRSISADDLERFDASITLGDGGRVKIRRVLGAALADAARKRYIPTSPAIGIRWPKRRGVRETPTWTPDEAKRFLECARSSNHFALFLVAIVGALGPAELFGIKWKYVDLDRGTVSIVANLTEVGGRLEYKEVKVPSRRRLVQLPKLAVSELNALHAKKKPKSDDYVFTAPEGGPARRTAFRERVWRPLLKKANVPRITPYGLRHSSASLLASLGVPLMVASRALGHSDIRTTANTYVHLFPEAHREIADRFDTFLEGV